MNTWPIRSWQILANGSLFAFLLLAQTASACDACGGGGVYNGFGFMPLADRPIFGLNYRQLTFSHPAGNWNGESAVLADRFLSGTATLLWMPVNRLRMAGSVPFRHHTRLESLQETHLTGVGDVRLDADLNVWESGVGFWVRLGGGISAPTGTYMARDAGLRQLPPSFQLGRGAWGGTARITAALAPEAWTVIASGETTVWGMNEQGYRAGNLHRVGVQVFRRVVSEPRTWLPQAGLNWERWQPDVERGTALSATSGRRLMGRAGVTFQRKSQLIHVAGELPISQNVASDAPALGGTIEVGWAWQLDSSKRKVQFL
jgi:hypothetical protein